MSDSCSYITMHTLWLCSVDVFSKTVPLYFNSKERKRSAIATEKAKVDDDDENGKKIIVPHTSLFIEMNMKSLIFHYDNQRKRKDLPIRLFLDTHLYIHSVFALRQMQSQIMRSMNGMWDE